MLVCLPSGRQVLCADQGVSRSVGHLHGPQHVGLLHSHDTHLQALPAQPATGDWGWGQHLEEQGVLSVIDMAVRGIRHMIVAHIAV